MKILVTLVFALTLVMGCNVETEQYEGGNSGPHKNAEIEDKTGLMEGYAATPDAALPHMMLQQLEAKLTSAGKLMNRVEAPNNPDNIGSYNNDFIMSSVMVGTNDTYVVGYTSGSLDGYTNAGGYDLFVAKYDGDWLMWWKQIGTSQNDYGMDIDYYNGNLYVTGYTYGAFSGTNQGGADSFLAIINATSLTSSVFQVATSGHDYGRSIKVVNSTTYIAGTTFGAFPGNSNAGFSDVFVSKITFPYRFPVISTKQWGGYGNQYTKDMFIDDNNDIYVTGYSSGYFGETAIGGYDVFVSKLVNFNSVSWTKLFGSTSNDYGVSIMEYGSTSLIFAGYTFGSTVDTNQGYSDVYGAIVMKSDGALYREFQVGSEGYDTVNSATMIQGDLAVFGSTTGSNWYDHNNEGGYDAMLLFIDTVWGDTCDEYFYSTPSNDYGQRIESYGYYDMSMFVNSYGSLFGMTNLGSCDAFPKFVDNYWSMCTII